MPPRAWNESGLGGIFTTVRFAIVATFVLIGFLAMPVFSHTAAASGATSVPAWKLELRGAPNPGDASDQQELSHSVALSRPIVSRKSG